jgi:hypothetical protein
MGVDATLNLVTTITVIFGVMFAVFEVLHMRARRRQNAALALVASYQTPAFSKAIVKALDVPDAVSRAELERRLGDDGDGAFLLMTTWESLGILVHKREVSLELVEDFFSGPISVSWTKYQKVVEEMREKLGRDTYFEWFQWLAERVQEHESSAPAIPAHIEHSAWKPKGGA